MDTDTVVLLAATAIAATAQLGILIFARPAGLREWGFVTAPAAGLVALVLFAWRSITG